MSHTGRNRYVIKIPSKNNTCTLSLLSLLYFEEGKENHQKTRISYPYRTLKIPGKEGKTLEKTRNSS